MYSTGEALWVLPREGDRRPITYLRAPRVRNGRLSPDGRWMTYESDESGTTEVYVRPFPDGAGGKWQLSRGGGRQPRWRADGKELYYVAGQGKFMSVDIDAGSAFSSGAPRQMFEASIADGGSNYDVSADGQRFLVNVIADDETVQTSALSVIVNWSSTLRK